MTKTPPTVTGRSSEAEPGVLQLPPPLPWKPDWPQAAANHVAWWQGRGLVLDVTAPLDTPRLDVPKPEPANLRERWVDPAYRAQRDLYDLSRLFMEGDHVPQGGTNVGAGDLAAMLGSRWDFAPTTVWFEPCLGDEDDRPLRLDRESDGFTALMAMVREQVRVADGRYLIGTPDLIENFDILASLRGTQDLLMDVVDRPAWVERRIDEINDAFFEAFDAFYDLLRDPVGGNVFCAFGAWGPGRTAKVQCDASSMLSPAMFRQFVLPALKRQCDWLDFAMFHLDGEECMQHVDALLEIESLQAIEWTPKLCYSTEGGGKPKWYDFYRRIKAGGKSVQAIHVKPDEVIPLLDAVGPEGMYIVTRCATEQEARQLLEQVQPYRPRPDVANE